MLVYYVELPYECIFISPIQIISDANADPEYVEFLELISKPVENLPSAEIQLERREAERAGL